MAGGFVHCYALPPLSVLRPAERAVIAAIRASPTRMLARQDVLAAYIAAGGTRRAGAVLVARSPVLEPAARAVYKVRGS